MRRILLDTHVTLWWLSGNKRLGRDAQGVIADVNNRVFVSAVTGWEISIKKMLGKLQAPDDLDSIIHDEGFEYLDITFFHGEKAGMLPPYHKDPFDRMLIAQAQAEGLEIVTDDRQITQYGVHIIPANK